MLTREELDALAATIPDDPERGRLLATLRERAAPLVAALPPIPRTKALLSRDGGICPNDGSPLGFDPWSPDRHRCTKCGESFGGDRHHRHWARAQHLWLAERMAELALVGVLDDDAAAVDRALELYQIYDDLYFELPNRDNVLGPSHLFFSTYLESLWLTSYLAGAFVLREAGRLPDERAEGIGRVAEEAAGLLADFNEGLSNRQSWHAAALAAVAAWFGDEELGRMAVESRTGVMGHFADGFGNDGVWWEGENYHIFALRGVMQGLHWSRALGYDLLADDEMRAHFRAALLAPARSALPDFTYPARRDSRYGVSLAEQASVELVEIGRGWMDADRELDGWLGALYSAPARQIPSPLYDAWLHDAGRTVPAAARRTGLSWWALTAMGGPLPDPAPPWKPSSMLLPDQGLAVLRDGDWYASLECGREIGGHGHPDRLHLTVHATGVHWLPDPGTGSYVEPVLGWYRSTLAHNAPRVDGVSAGGADAWCEFFEADEVAAWCRGIAGETRRTLVLTPGRLLDRFEFESLEAREVELPWHFMGSAEIETPGAWSPAQVNHPFVSQAERFVPATPGPIVVRISHPGAGTPLRAHFDAPEAEWLRVTGPGLPGRKELQPFFLLRARAMRLRWTVLLDGAPEGPERVQRISAGAEDVEAGTASGMVRYRISSSGLVIEGPAGTRTLGGRRPRPPKVKALEEPRLHEAEASAPHVFQPPALDGSLDGFLTGDPLVLDGEHQYRRSEEPYDPERFSAQAWVNWDGDALYVAVEVAKPEPIFRAPGAPPLALDNDPEDIHSDGLQLYLRHEAGAWGLLVIPAEDGGLTVRPIDVGASEMPEVTGGWAATESGYRVTLRVGDPSLTHRAAGDALGFELQVNEMQPERLRRAGQLAWAGGGGWIYLRGDRQDLSALGVLRLG